MWTDQLAEWIHMQVTRVCVLISAYHLIGLLLRLFSYWYDMDVVEEEAFLQWKEDISQEHPGKGKALFQVGYFRRKIHIHACISIVCLRVLVRFLLVYVAV